MELLNTEGLLALMTVIFEIVLTILKYFLGG